MGANPNTITAGIRETWDKQYQITHHKVPTYPAWANFRLAAGLEKGDTVNRQYRNSLVAKDMGADGSYATQAVVDTNEQLVVNKEKETSFYLKKLDELQNHLPVRAERAYDSAAALFNQIDGDILGSYDQYTNSLDDGDLAGTAGNGITVTESNVRKLFSRSNKLLQRSSIMLQNPSQFTGFRKKDFESTRKVALISPDVHQMLLDSLDGKDTALGDKVGINGHVGRYFDFDIFVTNALGWSAELTLGTLATDGDTVVINGVTFTFETGTLDAAGKVKAATDGDTCITNLVSAINNGESLAASTQGTNYYELSAANRLLMANITATADLTNNKLTIKATGYGYLTVSETLTAAADVWTAAKQVQHCLFGVNNAVDVVIQKTPSIEIVPVTGKVGQDFVTWAAYGFKVFNEQKPLMIDAWIRTDQY